METYLKATACVLVAVVLCLTLSKHTKEMSLLLIMTVCCMVVIAAITYLTPVISFLEKLQTVGNLDADLLRILFKAVGIGLTAEITSLICEDAGNSALGKGLKLLASAVILWLSVPLFTTLVELVEEILVML